MYVGLTADTLTIIILLLITSMTIQICYSLIFILFIDCVHEVLWDHCSVTTSVHVSLLGKRKKNKKTKAKVTMLPRPSFMQRRAVWAHWSEANQTYCFNLGWRSLCVIPRG